ncbi:hypothetical protein EYF80_036968 [Liparis tanakae]|uniref:Uncharacterized protein n=1 Tax=Liparis tanakae TaxID=230148 RepID=A0A4Z2GH51_9TELE|nr:hypothetical protein EYF80_036968 [Liparis tanakae]
MTTSHRLPLRVLHVFLRVLGVFCRCGVSSVSTLILPCTLVTWPLAHEQQLLPQDWRIRYLPSSSLRQMSMTQRRMPQAFSMLRLIWLANSLGLNCCVPRTTWRAESLAWYRDTLRYSDPASMAQQVQRASL